AGGGVVEDTAIEDSDRARGGAVGHIPRRGCLNHPRAPLVRKLRIVRHVERFHHEIRLGVADPRIAAVDAQRVADRCGARDFDELGARTDGLEHANAAGPPCTGVDVELRALPLIYAVAETDHDPTGNELRLSGWRGRSGKRRNESE